MPQLPPATFVRLALVSCSLLLAACSPAIDRPLRGAVPGSEATAAVPGAPPTLGVVPSFKPVVEPAPSPGVALSPIASPSAELPPIVRTVSPPANGSVPGGAPVTVSVVLVGRGADLASAQLFVDGAEVPVEPDRTNPRQWSVGVSKALPDGRHQGRVLVRDASGASGGFTWAFTVGAEPAEATPAPNPAPAAKPAPSPAT